MDEGNSRSNGSSNNQRMLHWQNMLKTLHITIKIRNLGQVLRRDGYKILHRDNKKENRRAQWNYKEINSLLD